MVQICVILKDHQGHLRSGYSLVELTWTKYSFVHVSAKYYSNDNPSHSSSFFSSSSFSSFSSSSSSSPWFLSPNTRPHPSPFPPAKAVKLLEHIKQMAKEILQYHNTIIVNTIIINYRLNPPKHDSMHTYTMLNRWHRAITKQQPVKQHCLLSGRVKNSTNKASKDDQSLPVDLLNIWLVRAELRTCNITNLKQILKPLKCAQKSFQTCTLNKLCYLCEYINKLFEWTSCRYLNQSET